MYGQKKKKNRRTKEEVSPTFSCLTLRLMLFKIIASSTGAYTCDSTLEEKENHGHTHKQPAGVTQGSAFDFLALQHC